MVAMENDGIYSMDESLEQVIRDTQKINEAGWGPWKLDRKRSVVYVDHPTWYEHDLGDLSPARLVNTLFLFAAKSWVTTECLGGLVIAAKAISEATHDPLIKPS
jgi:hypothetical protein